jgi:hypothetical protein
MSPTMVEQPVSVFDEGTFIKKVPYKLSPTNLKGVYVNPTPPDNFDLKSASQLDLARYALLVRKPGAGDSPTVHAAWDRFVSRKWLEKDRIVPESHPQIGVTHHLKAPLQKGTDGNYVNTVWSGAGGNTGSWTGIIGYWTVPTVSKPSEAAGTEGGWNSSSWIGLDGFSNSNDVLQAGVQQRVNANGTTGYYAWYEWYAPAVAGSPGYIYQTNIANFPIAPGQQVYCSVQYSGKTAGVISFANEATGQHFSITLAPPPGANFSGSSYEWIMECPDYGPPHAALPKFTPVVFTTAVACGASGASANPATGDTLNMAYNGKTLTSVTVGTDTCTIKFIG